MADEKTIRIKMDMNQELRDLLADLKKMDKESQKELKDEVAAISKWTAQGLIQSSYGAPMPLQAAVVASSIKARRDRIPNVVIGGTAGRKASGGSSKNKGATAGELLFGNEFGANPNSAAGAFANGGRRFPFRSASNGRGNVGYWIFPALREMQPEITQRWRQATDKIFRHWQRYG